VIIYVASKQATAFALGGAHIPTVDTLLLRTNDPENGGSNSSTDRERRNQSAVYARITCKRRLFFIMIGLVFQSRTV
jgi:hypothetical protein